MKDLTIRLPHVPGELARLGETLGAAGVSVEGGAVFAHNGEAIAHFLFADGDQAAQALSAAGIEVQAQREVVVQRLSQAQPGELGRIARRLADAGVNLDVMYSDHAHQLILVTEDADKAQAVSAEWGARGGRAHSYETSLAWAGNRGSGTSDYRSYDRSYEMRASGKPAIAGSSDPAFRGDRTRWNPEELLVASLSSCHQLAYLHLCADAGVVVAAYEDAASGVMRENAHGGGEFERVVLRPQVTVAEPAQHARALALHAQAHANCFIASSVRFPVEVQATIS